jgi:hypothetical protein
MDAKGVTPDMEIGWLDKRLRVDCWPTNPCADENSHFDIKDILGWCSKRSIDSHGGQRAGTTSGLKLYKVASASNDSFILLRALHRGRGHGSDDRGANAETITEGTSEVADLTDMKGNIWVFRSGCDSKLKE